MAIIIPPKFYFKIVQKGGKKEVKLRRLFNGIALKLYLLKTSSFGVFRTKIVFQKKLTNGPVTINDELCWFSKKYVFKIEYVSYKYVK